MSSIRLLPDHVANQIAAGEVVERPAAVIKELIENSLDAGATRIEIEYRNGGKSYLRVEDDGHGMLPDDAMLSLERHATSKIREADDLQSITSFGFRGEALPSIASVSRFIMRTRAKGEEGGSEILVNGGKLIHQKDCGMPEGTRIEVARLFNSVPVRRKFLRTDATEATHVCRLARLYAMAHPETAFTLMENNRMIFRSPTCTDFKERLREIFGGGFVEGLTEVEAASDSFSLSGLMGKPGVGRSTRQEMVFMINNRPVDSKVLSYAVIEAYHTYVPKGRYPPAFLFLQMEPSAVDVNVHPTKREVRFRDEGKLRAFVIRAIHDRLGKFADETGLHSLSTIGATGPAVPAPDFSSIPIKPLDGYPDKDDPHAIVSSVPERSVDSSGMNAPSEPASQFKLVGDRNDMVASWRFLGKMAGELALFRTDEGLIVLHCRAAQERLRFEEAEDAFSEEGFPDGQRLLLPASLELDAMGNELLQGHLPMLKKLGFSIEEFGRNYHRIEAVPSWLDLGDAELFVRDLIALAKDRGGSAGNTLSQEQLLLMLCARGDKAKSGFEESEIILMVDRLLRCRNPLTCPQGHPTYVEYGRKEWEKRFCRRF